MLIKLLKNKPFLTIVIEILLVLMALFIIVFLIGSLT